MSDARDRLKTIFHEALEIASPLERAAYLDRACASDATLRSQVDQLLASFDRASGSVHEAAPELEATVEMASQVTDRGTTIGPYKLLQQIGEGGMGVVHMAEQTEPVKRRVAVKIIKLGMDTQDVLARFEAERQALAMMDHPNIAKVLDAGTTATGRPYFVMELVNGLPITDYCDEQHLTTAERLQLFTQVCYAVQHAHQKGIIHRDLKPSNILVAEYDHEAVPKVIDFGVAKATNQSLTERTLFTQFGQIVGTMEYMSPEQAKRNQLDIDTRSDIYSLGVVLYELLTGEAPFDKARLRSAAMDELLKIIREEDPPRPSTRLSKSETLASVAAKRKVEPARLTALVRGDLDWIVMKTLEKDRARRYQTATALAADIENFFADQPVLACPPSSAYRLRKFVRRNRVPMVTAGLVIASLCIGLATTTWQTIVARKAKALADSRSTKVDAALKQAVKQRQLADERTAEAEAARQEEALVRQTLERRIYCSTMQRVQNSWQGRAFFVNRLLDSLTPEFTGGTDLRNFEWHYWHRRLKQPVQVLRGHVGIVHDLAYHPDGRHLATAGFDRSVRIWQVDSGTEVRALEGHLAPVTTVAFSPDGERLVSAGYDRLLKIWDWREPRELRTLSGHRRSVHSVAFSHDGQTLASASYDGTVRLWDVKSGQQQRILTSHAGEAWGVDFSPDDRLIASGHASSTVAIWHVEDGELSVTLDGHSDGVTCVKFNSDGTRLATASHDREARVWDVSSRDEVLTLEGHGNWVQSICWSSDDKSLLTASWDGTSRVWSADTGEERLSLRGHEAYVQSAEFSPDLESIASVGDDGTLRVWKNQSTRTSSTMHIAASRAGNPNYPSFSVNGRVVFVPSYTGTLRGWDIHTGRPVWEAPGGVGSAASSDGRVATGDQDGNVHIYEVASGKEHLAFLAEPGGFQFLTFSPDGKLLLTNGTPWGRNSQSTTVKIWNAHTGASIAALSDQTGWVSMVAFSPDGDLMATSSYDDTVKIWNTSNWQLEQTLLGHTDNVDAVAFSPSGQFVVSGAYDATARIWDWRSGRQIHELRGHRGNVLRVAYSPDGQRVASGSFDGEVKLWDVATGQEVLSLSCGRVTGLVFSPDGNHLVSTGFDGIHIWNATPRD